MILMTMAVVVALQQAPPRPAPPRERPTPRREAPAVYYQNCNAARAAGAAPIRRGEPGYRPALDRDGDGVALRAMTELDDPVYRAAVLTGRSRALAEMTDLVNRLAMNVEPEHGPEVTLGTLVSNWLEVVNWLTQAEAEAVDELTLLEQQRN